MHKASVMSVNTETNVHSTDWLMSVFVNELASPHLRSQGQYVQQCQRIMKDTLHHSIDLPVMLAVIFYSSFQMED